MWKRQKSAIGRSIRVDVSMSMAMRRTKTWSNGVPRERVTNRNSSGDSDAACYTCLWHAIAFPASFRRSYREITAKFFHVAESELRDLLHDPCLFTTTLIGRISWGRLMRKRSGNGASRKGDPSRNSVIRTIGSSRARTKIRDFLPYYIKR